MALFVNDTTQQEALCIPKTIERGGAVVVHLGGRRWAFISDRPQSVTINCPTDSTLPSIISLPKSGLLEIPLSCSAHTQNWVLPATIHKEKKEIQGKQPLDQFVLKEMDRGYEEHYTTPPTRTSIRSLSVLQLKEETLLIQASHAQQTATSQLGQIDPLTEAINNTPQGAERYPGELWCPPLILLILFTTVIILFRSKLRHLEVELEQLTGTPELNTRRCSRQPDLQQEEASELNTCRCGRQPDLQQKEEDLQR